MLSFYRVFLFSVIIYCENIFAQRLFVTYEDFKNDFKQEIHISELSNKYDLLYILLLDSTYKDYFFIYEPELKGEFPLYSAGLKSKEYTIGFLARYENIIDVIEKEESRIFSCLADVKTLEDFQYKFAHPIYVKDDTAIATVTNKATCDVLHFSLCQGVFQIKRLSRTFE